MIPALIVPSAGEADVFPGAMEAAADRVYGGSQGLDLQIQSVSARRVLLSEGLEFLAQGVDLRARTLLYWSGRGEWVTASAGPRAEVTEWQVPGPQS